MKKNIYILLFLFLCNSTYAQYKQIGKDFEGAMKKSCLGFSVSADGNRIAIASPFYKGAGCVRIYEMNGNSWSQLGSDIIGESDHNRFGSSISLEGNRIAIGAPRGEKNGFDAGHVRIFDWNGSSWNQLGLNINGEAAYDRSGNSVSLSKNRVAIGAFRNNGISKTVSMLGHVRVFEWNGIKWKQIGADIDGEMDLEYTGWALSLEGDRVAIGAPFNDGNGNDKGAVRIFEWNGTIWEQVGKNIIGKVNYSLLGSSVSLSGNRVAIGAPGIKGNVEGIGHLHIFEWNGSIWEEHGTTIDVLVPNYRSGTSVDLDEDRVVVAAGFMQEGIAQKSQIQILEWDGGAWLPLGLGLDGAENGRNLNLAVSLDDSILVVGMPYSSENALNVGKVRVYSLPSVGRSIDTHITCGSYTWIDGKIYTSNNARATYTYKGAAANGCDSIVRLNLTIQSRGVDEQVSCGSYTWVDGKVYTSNNTKATYTYKGGAVNGCDSTVVLHLTINQPVVGIDEQVSCGAYTWIDGKVYTSNNTKARFTYEGAAANGCDSTVILDLKMEMIDTRLSINGSQISSNTLEANYQWLDYDNNYISIDGEYGSTFIAPRNGTYAVEITQGTCVDTSSIAEIRTIKANDRNRYISVSPNPTTGLLYIERKVRGDLEVTIKDELGRVLFNQELVDKREAIDLHDFPAGVYFLSLSNNKGQVIKKIIKQ